MTPEELRAARERLAKIVADMRGLHESAKGRALSAEEKEKYERMEADFDALNDGIKRAERLLGFEAELNTVQREAVREGFGKQGDGDGDEAAYKREFFSFVQGRGFNPEVLKRNMNAGTNADGGYTVPTVLQKNVVRALLDSVLIRQLGTVISTTSTTQIPLGTTKPIFDLIAENGAYPETDTKFDIKTLNAYKVGGVIKASEELLNDSGIDIENYITTLMVEGIAAFEENKFINGTGGGTDFTGLTKGTVGTTTVGTNAVTADEIMDMYYSVANKYRPNASWVISDDFEKAVMKLKDSTGRYIWQLGLQSGAPNMLLNRPVYNSAYMPSLGTGNAIAVFGDLKYYQIGDRGSMTMKRLNELYAGSGQIGFQVAKRGDAKIILDEAIKVMKNA